jgi:hypothetical protein
VSTPRDAATVRLAAALYLLSGAAALVYQVAWQRILALYTGVGLYSVAVIVAAFLAGLGALATPWVLFPRLGVRGALVGAGVGSLLVGLGGWALLRRVREETLVTGARETAGVGAPRPAEAGKPPARQPFAHGRRTPARRAGGRAPRARAGRRTQGSRERGRATRRARRPGRSLAGLRPPGSKNV